MNSYRFLILLLIPFLAESFHTKFGPFIVSDRSIIYRGVYMYDTKESPKSSKDATSKISISIDATSDDLKMPLVGNVITAFMPEAVYNQLGYLNATGSRIACCDDAAFNRKNCSRKNELVIPKGMEKLVHSHTTKLSGVKSNIYDSFDIPKTDMYYVVTAICDPSISPLTHLEGKMTAQNAYGHLPATQYSSLPFFSWMFVAYVFVLVIWCMLCIQYSKEIMSVHLIILAVLCAFVCNYFVKMMYLYLFNQTGYDTLVYISTIVDCLTRTMTRILTVLVCMGLGVSRASISGETCKFVLFALSYFAVSLWDSILSLSPPSDDLISKARIYISAGMDALVYFWVFQSLMNTMDDLKAKKQNSKLTVFTKLYTLLLVSVVISTITLLVFSYLVNQEIVKQMWKYQWFMNDGIWCLYYFTLFIFLMVFALWKPSDNSTAYAYHSELATEAHDDDEYGLPQDALVESNDEGGIVVNTISTDMKPMNITAAESQT